MTHDSLKDRLLDCTRRQGSGTIRLGQASPLVSLIYILSNTIEMLIYNGSRLNDRACIYKVWLYIRDKKGTVFIGILALSGELKT